MIAMADNSGKPTILQAARAVFWSFLGIRRRSAHEQDLARLRPVHFVVAGLAGGLVFVLTLIALVRFVVSHVS